MNHQVKLIASLLWMNILGCLSISFVNAQEIAPKAYIPFVFQADLPSDPDYVMRYALDDDTAVSAIRDVLNEHAGEVKVYVREGSAWFIRQP